MNSRAEKRLNRCKSSSLYLFVLCYRLFIIFYTDFIFFMLFFLRFFLLLFIWYFWFSSHSFLFFDQGSKSKCNFNHCAWEIVKIASKSVWLVTGKKSTWILVLRVVQIVFFSVAHLVRNLGPVRNLDFPKFVRIGVELLRCK